jgi:integrase
MLLRDYLDAIYFPCRLVGRSDKTRKSLLNSAKLFDQSMLGDSLITDLTSVNIGKHLERLLKTGRKKSTVAKERGALLTIARHAAKQGIVKEPEVASIRVPGRIPRAYTMDELAAIFQVCRSWPGVMGGVPACLWWESIHWAIWDTGERIGALLLVEWADWDGRFLKINAENRKGATRDKAWEISPEGKALLQSIRFPARVRIWDVGVPNSTLYDTYHRILRRAGIQDPAGFHRMRKSVASHLAAAGANPSLVLDHSNPRTTARYLDPRITQQQSPASLLARIP